MGHSDAYLGTPWVWPSIWKDNTAQVENQHRIYPGERIWISPHEMRKISDAEAEQMESLQTRVLGALGYADPYA